MSELDAEIELRAYDVVGATLVPDEGELPLRLRPILQNRETPDEYRLVQDESDEGSGGAYLLPEDADYIEERFAEQRFHRFTVPWPARPGYWLVQFRPQETPEYLPTEIARERIRQEGLRSLELANRALHKGQHDQARTYLGYASRALEDDPLPRLALIALWRDAVTASQLEVLAQPLTRFSPQDIKRRMQLSDEEASLLECLAASIRSDPLAAEYGLGANNSGEDATPEGRLMKQITIRCGKSGRAAIPLPLASRVPELWVRIFANTHRENAGSTPKFYAQSASPGSYTVKLRLSVKKGEEPAAFATMERLACLELYRPSSENVRDLGVPVLREYRSLINILARYGANVEVRVFRAGSEPGKVLRIAKPDEQLVKSLEVADRYIGSADTPQADSLDRIFELVEAIKRGVRGGRLDPEDIGVETQRQVSYYRHAAEVMGYSEGYELTPAGEQIARLRGDDRLRSAVVHFESSRIGRAWILWSSAENLLGVDADTAEDFLQEMAVGIGGDTIPRRAKTLRSWHRRLVPFHYGRD